MQTKLLPGDVMAAPNTTTHNVEVTDNGSTANVIKNIETLIKSLKAAQQQASATFTASTAAPAAAPRTAAPTPGGTAGSRGVAESMMSGSTYGTLRATGVGTGAAARDFAKESQGLGGLVRLYATYAANVFAVSAAFNALSNAMNTTNMIKSMDQLGASVGKSLGTVAQNIVKLTDGAINLRDSMQAVAQSSSAGMASKDIERLAMVAKNASLSLGLSMPDALNRLSRGITKLEPELLDELGLFTKIGPATETYARNIGKTVSSLTDFERRQAFANAVIKEGEEKFSALGNAVNVNPYDKLASSLQNLSQKGLEIVNTVLGPIVKLLSESPVALTAAIGALGVMLVKQALPALGEFKQGLADTAATALQTKVDKAAAADLAKLQQTESIKAAADARAEAEVNKLVAAEKRLQDLKEAGLIKLKKAKDILAKDLDKINEEDLAYFQKKADDAKKPAQKQGWLDVKNSIIDAQKANDDYTKAVEKNTADITAQRNSSWSVYGANLRAAEAAEKDAEKARIISNANQQASLTGLTDGFRLLNAEIAESPQKFSALEKGMLRIRGTFAILAGAASAFGAAVTTALNVIGVVITVITLLDAFFSKNVKQMSDYSSAIDSAEESIANVNRTIDILYKTSAGNPMSIKGINALANAFQELAKSAEDAAKKAVVAKESMGWLEKIKDSIASGFGGGLDKTLASTLASQIMSSFKILDSAGMGEQARSQIKATLGTENLTFDSLKEAILKVGTDGVQPTIDKLLELARELSNVDSRTQKFKATLETTNRAYQDYLVSVANKDPLFKLGENVSNTALAMLDLKDKGILGVSAAMLELSESAEKTAFFGPEFTTKLLDIKEGLADDVKMLKAYKGGLLEVNKQIEQFQESDLYKQNKDAFESGRYDPKSMRVIGLPDYKTLTNTKATLENQINLRVDGENFKKAQEVFAFGVEQAFKKGSQLIQDALKNGAELNAIKIAQAGAQGLTGERKADALGKLTQQEINIRLRSIKNNIDLILNQDRLIASIEENSAALALDTASREGKSTKEASDRLAAAQIVSKVLSEKTKSGIPDFQGGVNKAINESTTDAGGPSDMARSMAILKLGQREAVYSSLRQAVNDATAESKIADKATQFQKIAGKAEDDQRVLAIQGELKQLEDQRLNIRNNILGVTTEELVKEEILASNAILANKQAKENRDLKRAQEQAEATTGEYRQKEIDAQKILAGLVKQRQAAELDVKGLQDSQKLLDAQLYTRNKLYELDKSSREIANAKASAQLDINSAQISAYTSLFENSKEYTNTLQNQNEEQKIGQEYASKSAQEFRDIYKKREDAQDRINALGGKDVAKSKEITAELDKQEKEFNDRLDLLGIEANKRTEILKITKQQQAVQLAIDKTNRENELELSKLRIKNTLTNNSLNLEQARFDVFKSLSSETDEYIINQQFALNLRKEEESTLQQIIGLQQDLNNKRRVSATKVTAFKEAGGSGPELAKLEAGEKANLEFETQKTQNAIAAINLEQIGRSNTLGIQKEQAIEQARYNKQLLDANTFATNLKDTFGTFGDKLQTVGAALGSIVTGLAEESIRQEKYSKLNLKNQTALNAAIKEKNALEYEGADDEAIAEAKKKVATIEKKIADDDNKNTKSQLSNAATTVSSFKKAFSEKTTAYKAFAAVEKAIGIAKIALDIQKMISDAAATSSSVANSNIRAAAQVGEAEVSGTAAVLKTMASVPFPANIIAATLVAAAVGTLLSKIGGKGTSFNAPAENVGTGTTLGDKNKPSETLSKSIEILSESDPILMRNSTQMLKHLRSIDYNIANLGAVLAKSLGAGDIATGKVGVEVGTRQSAIQQLIGGGGAIGMTSGALTGAAIGSFLGPIGTVLGGVAGALIGAVGLLKTQVSIQGQGIETVNQTIQQIKDQGFQGRFYADVKTTNKLGPFSLGSDTNRQYATLDADLKRNFELIFKNVGDALISTSEILGENTQQITDKVNNFVVQLGTINLQGLSSEDQQARLEAVFGAEIDRFVTEILPKTSDFAQVGEGLGTTLARVVYGVESANNGLAMLGIQAIKYTDIINKQGDVGGELVRQSILATETQTLIKRVIENADGSAQDILELYTQLDTLRDKLVDLGISQDFLTEKTIIAAGGTDKFSDAIDKLYDNFTTDTFKLQVETAKATAVFEKYGLTLPKTRQGFFDLFQTISTTSPEAAGALLKVLDSIDALYANADKISDERKTLDDKLAEAALTNLQLREREIQKIQETNRIYQRQVWAYQDVQNAAKAYQTSLANTIKTYATQITSLKDYKTSLTSGANTTLTATEQYASAKSEMESLVATIKDAKTTQADRDAAVGKLSGVTDRFLGLSKQLYASGAQYSVDFQTVSTTVDDVIGGLQTQKTTAELQLTTLETSEAYLEKIADSSKTTADLLKEYNTAITERNRINTEIANLNKTTTTTTTGGTTTAGGNLFVTSNQILENLYNTYKNHALRPNDYSQEQLALELKNIATALENFKANYQFKDPGTAAISTDDLRGIIELINTNRSRIFPNPEGLDAYQSLVDFSAIYQTATTKLANAFTNYENAKTASNYGTDNWTEVRNELISTLDMAFKDYLNLNPFRTAAIGGLETNTLNRIMDTLGITTGAGSTEVTTNAGTNATQVLENVGTTLSEDLRTVGTETVTAVGNVGTTTSGIIADTGLVTSETLGTVGITTCEELGTIGTTITEELGRVGTTTSETLGTLGTTTSETLSTVGTTTSETLSTVGTTTSETLGIIGITTCETLDSISTANLGAIETLGIANTGAIALAGTASAGAIETSGLSIAGAINSVGEAQTAATTQAINDNIGTLNTTIVTNNQVVADQIITGFDVAADRIIQAINAGTVATVMATDNNTQIIAGSVSNAANTQATAARITNTAIASYKRTDLGTMAEL
jgi:hypothetical protein